MLQSGQSEKRFPEALCILGRDMFDVVGFRSGFDQDVAPSKHFAENGTVQLDIINGLDRNNIVVFDKPATTLKGQPVGFVFKQDFGTVGNHNFVPKEKQKKRHSDADNRKGNHAGYHHRLDPIKKAVVNGNPNITIHNKISIQSEFDDYSLHL